MVGARWKSRVRGRGAWWATGCGSARVARDRYPTFAMPADVPGVEVWSGGVLSQAFTSEWAIMLWAAAMMASSGSRGWRPNRREALSPETFFW